MELEKSAYKDPMKWLMEKQDRSCKGCIHAKPFVMLGKSYEACAKGRVFGVKCKLYKETE